MSDGVEARDNEEKPVTRFSRGRLSRGRGLRKTTGCLTCRKRHVKCDEVKPVCGGCNRTNNVCHYDNKKSKTRVTQSSTRDRVENATPLQAEAEVSEDIGSTFDQLNNEVSALMTEPQAQNLSQENQHTVTTISNTTPCPHRDNYSMLDPEVNTPTDNNILNRVADFHFTHAIANLNNRGAPSTTSSNHNVENATARWVGLLFQDAVMQNEGLWNMNFEAEGFNIFGNSVAHSPVDSPELNEQCDLDRAANSPENPYLSERHPVLGQDQILEKRSWISESPIAILTHEHIAFETFVKHISEWMDLFDPNKSFAIHVPHLAVHNVGLMNAILALSVRYMSLNPSMKSMHKFAPNDALQYYYKTLHYIQQAMQYDTYKTSLELVATSLIISTYEMLDGSSKDWERHLHGVFWIQRSQVIHGDSKGLRQAVWWAWLCQDVFAAYLEKRKPFTFWRPTRNLDELSPHELAARAVYYFAQVVGYCAFEEVEAGKRDVLPRIARGTALRESLQLWRRHLTVEFKALPLMPPAQKEVFEPLWIHPPAFGVAMQLFHASNILLSLHCPILGDLRMYSNLRKSLNESIRAICGIAMALDDFASSLICSQCLFIAGLPLESPEQRCFVLGLLDRCRQRAGWPIRSLSDKLMNTWRSMD
ncbi:fungal-specific transcription factor domain-containing protein [Camillea tinctor]|nr:fungal-specific transcription factor domain-containing protein [Camillea tinctor]